MSWIDKIENIKFEIKTGDGSKFYPLWKGASKSFEFNVSEYNFINVSGSFIDRKKPKSGRYPLRFWFQGDDNIEQTSAFEVAAKDSRLWEIVHPFYGTIKGHPTNYSRNDDGLNVTEITVEFLESITDDYPDDEVSVSDMTAEKKDRVLLVAANVFSVEELATASDVQKLKESNFLAASAFKNIQSDDTFAEFQNKVARAQKAADGLLGDSMSAIQAAQSIIDYPSIFDVKMNRKLKAYGDAFGKMKSVFNTVVDKLFYESQSATIIASYANATANAIPGDFETLPEVETAIENLLSIYDSYLSTLDSSSVGIYETGTYSPDPELQNNLAELVLFTVANLRSASFQAKQEKIFYTDSDTNIIILTHRFYGLASDENIELFKNINSIDNDELFRIPKGRKIIYYN